MQTIAADIYAVQEVADDNAFNQLVANLPGHSGVLSTRWSQYFTVPPDPNFPPQKVGFVYNTSTVQLVNSRAMFSQFYETIRAASAADKLLLLSGYPTTGGNTPDNFWSSGRLPFMATFDVTLNGATKRIRVVNVHAKSGSAAADYDRRKYDVKVLYDSLLANYANDNIILLGDLNDDVDTSIRSGFESTYKPFVENTASFNSLTLSLSQSGGFSFPNSNSFLDHIITSNELTSSNVSNSTAVEDPRTYISNYVNNTSDHLPVSTRFVVTKENQTITFAAIADKNLGDAPFTFTLPTSTSGLAVTTTPNAKVTINGNQITLVNAGKASITASQLGNGNYNEAPSVTREFCIKPAKPSVTVSFASGTATLTSSAASSNQWFLNGAVIAGATNNTYTATSAGTYKVQVAIDNCVSNFSNDTPILVTGDLSTKKTFVSVYPNPTEDRLVITGLEEDTQECAVVDLFGRSHTLGLTKQDGAHVASTQIFSPGVYLVRVQQSNGAQQIRFVKK
jgi:endonuclease/exonuclease/phosphatase family metal-dependent hydrolase